MINKGELRMRYENIENVEDTNVYRQACENVKKIVKAIKAIKIKYYSNFARISKEDKEAYDELEENLEKISRENGLDNLKVALMEEVSARYDKKEISPSTITSEVSILSLLILIFSPLTVSSPNSVSIITT